jgi:hypothetical protein
MEVSPGMLTLTQPLLMFFISQSPWPCAVAQVIIALAALTGLEVKMVSPYLVCQIIGAIGFPPSNRLRKIYLQTEAGFSSPKKKPIISEPDLIANFMVFEEQALVKIPAHFGGTGGDEGPGLPTGVRCSLISKRINDRSCPVGILQGKSL